MKLDYKNLTICSKAEGSIPVCDTTCVPQLQENLMNSTLQLYLLLDTIYAGYMQVTLQSARTVTIAMRLANIGKDFALLHRQYVYMLLFYVLYRWDIKQVMMEVDAKEQQLQENLVQLGFQRIEYEQEHPAIAKTPLLYRLQKSDFNRTDNQDATELQKLSLEQLWELFPIVIRPYNEQYTAWYDAQRLRLQSLLKASIVRISHMGSTAVKGLEAKPCVDILLETDTRHPQKLIETLTRDGWILMSRKQEEQGDILCFNKGYTALGFTEKVYHLHVRYPAAWGELYFCEYLRTHDAVCRKYAALKKNWHRPIAEIGMDIHRQKQNVLRKLQNWPVQSFLINSSSSEEIAENAAFDAFLPYTSHNWKIKENPSNPAG